MSQECVDCTFFFTVIPLPNPQYYWISSLKLHFWHPIPHLFIFFTSCLCLSSAFLSFKEAPISVNMNMVVPEPQCRWVVWELQDIKMERSPPSTSWWRGMALLCFSCMPFADLKDFLLWIVFLGGLIFSVGFFSLRIMTARGDIPWYRESSVKALVRHCLLPLH